MYLCAVNYIIGNRFSVNHSSFHAADPANAMAAVNHHITSLIHFFHPFFPGYVDYIMDFREFHVEKLQKFFAFLLFTIC